MKLNDQVISRYPDSQHLSTTNNSKITDISFLSNLAIIFDSKNYGIDQKAIFRLIQITTLDVSWNPKITHVNRQTYLDACGNCSIVQKRIELLH